MTSSALIRELKARFKSDVLTDPVSLAAYASGACLYRVKPLAVIRPRNRDEVVEAVNFSAQAEVPLVGRGGGTSRCGNELGEGLILDFSRHLNQIVTLDPAGRRVTVQPGLILGNLNQALAGTGLFFPVDPSTQDYCTLGGMLANNSSGPHAVRYGTIRDWAISLEVVLSNGEVIRTGPVAGERLAGLQTARSLEGHIYRDLPRIVEAFAGPLQEEEPRVVKNSAGYHLWRAWDGSNLDLTPLLIGSEGTLGLITEATLTLAERPRAAGLGLLYFDDLERLGRAVQEILTLQPSMVEIIERHILDLAREALPELRPYLPPDMEAVLLVEFQAQEEETLPDLFARLEERVIGRQRLSIGLKKAQDKADAARLQAVRSISGPILNQVRGKKKPLAFIEDAAVHPDRLPEYIAGLRRIFGKFQVESGIYGHAGDGELHLMVFLDLTDPPEVQKMVAIAEAVYDLVLGLKGTISGEHGDGRLRSHYLKKQYPRLYPAFVEVKNLFDPQNILNPGVIVTGEENPLGQSLKFGPDFRPGPTPGGFAAPELRAEMAACSGCGKCRSYCPVAKAYPEEMNLSRTKASLVRELMSGRLEPQILDSPEWKKVFALCLNCKRCLKECPSGADIPWLALASRAEEVKKGRAWPTRLLAETERMSRAGSRLAPLANWLKESRPWRAVLEKALGLTKDHRLPDFARPGLPEILRRRKGLSGPRKVVYFPGCPANYCEPEEGLAALAVLEANGFEVLVPDFRCCGVAKITAGLGEEVRAEAARNLEIMGPYLKQGLKVVFTEPSCLLAFRLEYPRLLPQAAGLADGGLDIFRFLLDLHGRGEMNLDLKPLDLEAGFHLPCHLRALDGATATLKVLSLIPGLKVRPFSDLCCGLGGTFGLKKNYSRLSQDMGRRLMEEIAACGAAEILTNCRACGLRIEEGAGRKALHPIRLLARSYGLGRE